MRRIIILCALVMSGSVSAFGQPVQQRASFDCARATASIERAICADPELAHWDGHMGQAFRAKYAQLGTDQRRALLEDQHRWLTSRNNQCNVAAYNQSPKLCILQLTKDRVAALETAIARPLDAPAMRVVPAKVPGHVISVEEQAMNRAAAEADKELAIQKYTKAFAMLAARNRQDDPNSITVDVAITVTDENPPKLMGTTNLPDGTILWANLHGLPVAVGLPRCSPRCYFEFESIIVQDGRFTATLKTTERLTPDAYAIDVGTPMASLEPKSVQAIIGGSGEHLYGPYVVTLEPGRGEMPAKFPRDPLLVQSKTFLGYMIHYTQEIAIVGNGEAFITGCVPKLGMTATCGMMRR